MTNAFRTARAIAAAAIALTAVTTLVVSATIARADDFSDYSSYDDLDLTPDYDFTPPSDSQRLEQFVPPAPLPSTPGFGTRVLNSVTTTLPNGSTVRPTIVAPCCSEDYVNPPVFGPGINYGY